MILAPVAVLSLLVRGSLSEIFVGTVRIGFPLVVNHGLILNRLGCGLRGRLGFVAAIMVVVIPAAGGQNCRNQSGAQKAQGEFSQDHGFFLFEQKPG